MAGREISKGPQAFRTISEASAELGVPPHVLRFWETKFSFIRPMKRAGGRRFYRPQDLDVLKGVRVLLHEGGYTIQGVQRLHRESGVRRLIGAGAGDLPPPAARTAVSLEEPIPLETAETFEETAVPEAAPEPPDAPNEAPDDLGGATPPDTAILKSRARARLEAVLRDLDRVKAGVDRLLSESEG